MAMSRLKKNVVAAALAGSMVIALPGAAFATTVEDNGFTVDKTWKAASNTQLNNTEAFNFQVQFTGATAQGTWEPAQLSTDKVVRTLTADWKDLAGAGASANARLTARQLFAGYNFTAPGTYNFTVKEIAGSNPNIVYDGTVYNVEVVVSMPDDYPASDTPVIREIKAKAASGNKADKAAFENTAKANDSLTVSKKVAGAAANTKDEFSYTLKIEGAQGSYDAVKGNDKYTVEAGKDFTFKLKHGESIEIKNLPDGAKYTVVEDDTDYTEKNVADGVAGGAQAAGTIKAHGSTVAYTNEKGFAPATGVNSDTMPFVFGGLVVVAGASALLISRKRRASEEF
ncbi:DUF5979 domain-containing protein [uncultured Senegalimassilia sp.]|uniref:DUF7601 domain-containing protein n=1 Tax=uncultured Senegalimassilia sp. TaxID=1714350 RepID=UPI0025F8D7B4|nr:DUF5979 domain-containing protein [uncultured Senegalimassilia sp.]